MNAPRMTDEQRHRIFGLVKELGWSDERRRRAMRSWVGKDSLAADAHDPVTRREAAAIIGNLNVAVAKQRATRRRRGASARANWPEHRATPEQLREIGRAAKDVFGGIENGREAFLSWLARYFKVSTPSQLSMKRATGVITALHKMESDGWRPEPHGTGPPDVDAAYRRDDKPPDGRGHLSAA